MLFFNFRSKFSAIQTLILRLGELCCHTLQVFQRLPSATSFSRTCHQLNFRVLAIRYTFSRACHLLQDFARLSFATSFRPLITRCKFCRACHPLQCFSVWHKLKQVSQRKHYAFVRTSIRCFFCRST